MLPPSPVSNKKLKLQAITKNKGGLFIGCKCYAILRVGYYIYAARKIVSNKKLKLQAITWFYRIPDKAQKNLQRPI